MTTPWKVYCDTITDAIREDACERIRAAHTAPHATPPDLLDFCSGLGEVELEAHHLADLLSYAEECGAARGPVLRAHLADLRHMQAELAALVAEAEAA